MSSSTLSGVDLIVHDLETTKLHFTHGILHSKISMTDKGFKEECSYCGEGVLAYKAGINKDRLTNMGTIAGIKSFDLNEAKLFKRYGIHFVDMYPNLNIVRCPRCSKKDMFFLRCLEVVITHFNDVHSDSFKELAQNLREMNEIYNLVTGETRNNERARI